MIGRHPSSTLFPYTTLFRSRTATPPWTSSPPPLVLPTARPATSPRRSTSASASPPAVRASRSRPGSTPARSEEHTSELQSRRDLVCRLLLEKKKQHISQWRY